MKYIQPKITLVGAGPGDPELLTLKGQRALQTANVILYDALVNEQLLTMAPQATAVFVGKRKGYKALSQDEINRRMVQEAFSSGHVVRLKGGDPFVFGRGGEEVAYARLFGIPAEIVPGISSAIAVPGLAGIPVTHRGISNGFYVITAVLADGSVNPELERAVTLNATVVILMGLGRLQEIAGLLCKAGKKEMPVAVISSGSLPEQALVTGTANDIAEKVLEQRIKAPAVIVAGEVATLAKSFGQTLSFKQNHN